MADAVKFVVPDAVEQKSGTYRAQIVDENKQPISANVLTSYTLTLYDLQSGGFINGRNKQNVLNANQVTVDLNGNVVWIWLPADMTIINAARTVEEHVALFEAKWVDSLLNPRQNNHEVHFMVNRIPNV